jgi:hypothetical protein
MGPWGEAGRPSIRAQVPSPTKAAQHAIRGVRRNLCDDGRSHRATERAYTPSRGSLASTVLGRGQRRGVKHRLIPPQRKQDATEASG